MKIVATVLLALLTALTPVICAILYVELPAKYGTPGVMFGFTFSTLFIMALSIVAMVKLNKWKIGF